MLELPPRARRIRSSQGFLYSFFGTTSACAENTATAGKRGAFLRNYLRVRGEYMLSKFPGWEAMELPPRARRIPDSAVGLGQIVGTTSACAENTWRLIFWCFPNWNYLRVRGEYMGNAYQISQALELPPRARRIPVPLSRVDQISGTTSACAENTDATHQ